MSTTFYSGNERTLLIKKQDDKDTPVSDFTDAIALRVYEFSREPVRQQGPLEETDASAQQGASKVQSVGPALSFGVYGRASELDLIAELLLGDNEDSSTNDPTTHHASPSQDQPYFSLMDVIPYGDGNPVYDGCRITTATFTGQDTEGDTFLRVTGIQVMSLGIEHGVAAPDPLPTPADDDPFIHAEAAVSYDDVHPGTTKAFSVTVTRNSTRSQGDSGFRALDITPGKFQVDGTLSRYTQDDETLRLVDTGTTAGTEPTTVVAEESLEILYDRPDAGLAFAIASAGISYETREEAIDPSSGQPYVEVLGFRTQPQADIANNISILTTNAKDTTEG